MELPIDHFRLLGVSPTTDSETVLRTLQQRLDRAPDQGFTHDTLQARAELLQASAELLSDEDYTVARQYGCKGAMGMKRAVFLVDEAGVVRHAHVEALALFRRKSEELLEIIAALDGEESA